MKNKKNTILFIILIVVIILIIIFSFLFLKKDRRNIEDNKIDYNEYGLPKDDNLDDNKKLYGSWNSLYTEIYKDNKLSVTLKDTNKFNIQISMDDEIVICYISDEELICQKEKYSFIDNMLYISNDETYLMSKSKIIFKDNYLIIKNIVNNDSEYSLLYFEKK